MTMDLRTANPMSVRDWDPKVEELNGITVFHSAEWARVLAESYGFKPVYFISEKGGRPDLLVPIMEVSSPLTGRRGVSLPFSDTCAAIVPETEVDSVRSEILGYGKKAGWSFVEFRDDRFFRGSSPASMKCLLHTLPLSPSIEERFDTFKHPTKNSVRKAMRQGVTISRGRSSEAMEIFYALHCRTRRRHGLPPQPVLFFRKVHDHLISKGKGCVVEASYRGRVIASAVCLYFGKEAIVKYSAYDDEFQIVRPNNLLVWNIIVWSGLNGFERLSFGRSELEHEGLLRFKRGWNLDETPLLYYRYDLGRDSLVAPSRPVINAATKVLPHVPVPMLRALGRISYRHFS